MNPFISQSLLGIFVLFLPLASFPETLQYVVCKDKEGALTYRVPPCKKGQQEIRRAQAVLSEPESAEKPAGKQARAQQEFAFAESAYKSGNFEEAASWYRKAAEIGSTSAQFSLGMMYDIGQGVAQDYGQALFWYERAAAGGNAKAQNNLGFMYSQGKGVSQDYVKAHMWFNISAAKGFEDARKNREFIESAMTPEQVSQAQQMAGQWMKTHP